MKKKMMMNAETCGGWRGVGEVRPASAEVDVRVCVWCGVGCEARLGVSLRHGGGLFSPRLAWLF